LKEPKTRRKREEEEEEEEEEEVWRNPRRRDKRILTEKEGLLQGSALVPWTS
jgi:hypothetical protein